MEEQKIIDLFARAKDEAKPSPALLSKIINQAAVTKPAAGRYYQQGSVGRTPSIFNNLINFMSSIWKIIVPVGVVAIILAVVGYSHFAKITAPAGVGQIVVQDDVDLAVDSFIKEAVDEESAMQDEENDAALINYDSQELGAFDKLYDSSEL